MDSAETENESVTMKNEAEIVGNPSLNSGWFTFLFLLQRQKNHWIVEEPQEPGDHEVTVCVGCILITSLTNDVA